MQLSSLAIIPKISEKSYDLSEKRNTYTFVVPKNINKITIKDAVEKQYSVSVVTVNTTVLKGKPKQSYKKSGRRIPGARPSVKKAYVVLKKGDSISAFAGQSEDDKGKPKSGKTKKKEAK